MTLVTACWPKYLLLAGAVAATAAGTVDASCSVQGFSRLHRPLQERVAFLLPANTARVRSDAQKQKKSQHFSSSSKVVVTNSQEENLPEKEKWVALAAGPPAESKPNYDEVFGPFGKLWDGIFLSYFRRTMAEVVGFDSKLPEEDFTGIMELAAALNARYADRTVVQDKAHVVLQRLFPRWLLEQYIVLFSRPFPAFSARMNAWATKAFGTWLLGDCEVVDLDPATLDQHFKDASSDGTSHGLLVKRCRFLEEAGCASICVNSCKIPTQRFFTQDMGLPLTMEPNYETFECTMQFGRRSNEQDLLQAMDTPCLSRCPSLGALRTKHQQQPPNLTATRVGSDTANQRETSSVTGQSGNDGEMVLEACTMMNTSNKAAK